MSSIYQPIYAKIEKDISNGHQIKNMLSPILQSHISKEMSQITFKIELISRTYLVNNEYGTQHRSIVIYLP